jgi:hypothetical protein
MVCRKAFLAAKMVSTISSEARQHADSNSENNAKWF